MSTFLELCQNVQRDSGISNSNTLSGVVAQTGMNKSIVDAVNSANLSIQGKFHDWKFLWKEWTQLLDVGANSGTFNEYAAPSDIGQFIYRDNAIRVGSSAITLCEYERVRVIAQSTTTGTPSAMIIMPSGRVRIYPIPTVTATLVAEYYRSPLPMTANGEISLVPAAYHRAIETLALANISAHIGDWENYKRFLVEHQAEMIRLEAAQISGHLSRTTGAGEDNAVIAE